MAYLRFGKGGHGERAEREPITGAWGRSPQRGLGAEPLIGGQGAKPPEAETLFAFEHSTEAANSPIFSEICWKTAKNAPFHIKSPKKIFMVGPKEGASHHAPLNTPLVVTAYQSLSLVPQRSAQIS